MGALERLAEGVWNLDKMATGFASSSDATHADADVEHAAELSADSLAPLLAAAPTMLSDLAGWQARAKRLGELFATDWLGVNDRGAHQFRSTRLNSPTSAVDAKHACAVPLHVRAIGPALVLWVQLQNSRVGLDGGTWPLADEWEAWSDDFAAALAKWLAAFVAAANAAGEGCKPAGALPAALRCPEPKARRRCAHGVLRRRGDAATPR